ncbi:hypothetical protein OG756_21070 [Streptomyces sp. NBC_01310]|nr:hypothetical protein OG756_21070 [Streptomyces sp. NBC_01310]
MGGVKAGAEGVAPSEGENPMLLAAGGSMASAGAAPGWASPCCGAAGRATRAEPFLERRNGRSPEWGTGRSGVAG